MKGITGKSRIFSWPKSRRSEDQSKPAGAPPERDNLRRQSKRQRVIRFPEPNSSQGAAEAEGIASSPPVEFAHASEEEFARVLDFYQVRWVYEPRSFPVEWDSEGNVKSAFTPDFYLPDFDIYIELTTLKQSLVTRKNRKIRMFRELYPDKNLKVLYSSDYKKLVEKFVGSRRLVPGS